MDLPNPQKSIANRGHGKHITLQLDIDTHFFDLFYPEMEFLNSYFSRGFWA